ncbi:hypothetical protein C8R44DRAFT_890538 [Mycena epipterygia]|nr:hypothetical protein C8R44DRAFT_890538 [Mycena epipterygia]
MADNPHYPEGHSSESPASSDSEPSPSSGAFITNSRNFTITGGQFTNVVNCAPAVPLDFRTIPLGDLDLRHEIRLEKSGEVTWQHGTFPARRIYTARIEGKQSDMTVAVYQGKNAEENWRRKLAHYSGLRLVPSTFLYGAVNSGGLYAMIFTTVRHLRQRSLSLTCLSLDLVPYDQFFEENQQSVISTVYLYAQFSTEFNGAAEYVQPLLGEFYSACLTSSVTSGPLTCRSCTFDPYLGYGVQQVDSALRLHPIPPTTSTHSRQRTARTTSHYPLSALNQRRKSFII